MTITNIDIATELIKNAEAVLITAGAGIGIGLKYRVLEGLNLIL